MDCLGERFHRRPFRQGQDERRGRGSGKKTRAILSKVNLSGKEDVKVEHLKHLRAKNGSNLPGPLAMDPETSPIGRGHGRAQHLRGGIHYGAHQGSLNRQGTDHPRHRACHEGHHGDFPPSAGAPSRGKDRRGEPRGRSRNDDKVISAYLGERYAKMRGKKCLKLRI